jgi:hypothetical protein
MAKSNTKGVGGSKATVVFKGPDTLIGPQGITQGGVSYITTNYGKALGFDSGKFVSTLEGIRFAISEYSKEPIEDVDKYHLKEIERFFSDTVIEANIVTGPGGLGIDVEVLYNAKDKATRIELDIKARELIGSPTFTKIVNQIPFYFWNVIQQSQSNLKKEKELEKKAAELAKKEDSKLHKQPRGYLKTTAKLVGKSTSEPTLFSLPMVPEPSEGEGNYVREVISKNTAILGNYLMQLWQENGGRELRIFNLAPLSEMMGVNNHELKIYLLYLGGYTYPIYDKDKDGLTLTVEQLFKIEFKYGKAVADKYPLGNFNTMGNSLSSFIKDEPVESVVVTPSTRFLNAMKGQGLGTVLAVNDKFVKMVLSLTDIAYKICSFSASNMPTQKIGEKNLVNHLGLEKQMKTQGKPRVRATILRGFQELEDKGHIKKYSFDEERETYSFTYSDKYIKHQHRKRGDIEPE